ncbi:hypothetical protein D1872_214970 [compost metagenome]
MVIIFTRAKNTEPHQRIAGQIKSLHLILFFITSNVCLLFRLDQTADIFIMQPDTAISEYGLDSLVRQASDKAGPQYFMPLHQMIEAIDKCIRIKASGDVQLHLLKVETGLRIHQVMEHHTFLHWSQHIYVFQFANVRCLCCQSIEFFQRQSLHGDITRCQFRVLLCCTMRQNLMQLIQKLTAESLHRFSIIVLFAISYRQRQHATGNHSVQIESMLDRRICANRLTCSKTGLL